MQICNSFLYLTLTLNLSHFDFEERNLTFLNLSRKSPNLFTPRILKLERSVSIRFSILPFTKASAKFAIFSYSFHNVRKFQI